MSESHFGKSLLAFACGVGLGAAVGILFAPDKGTKTRKKIMKKTKDLSDAVCEKLESIIESAEEVVEELKENASNYIHTKEKMVEDAITNEENKFKKT